MTAFGRYLDSEMDLVVDAALFAGIGWYTGNGLAAFVGFLALTTVLNVNFNVERLYRAERGGDAAAMPEAEGGPTGLLRRVYAFAYAPQDRLVERFVEWRLRDAPAEARLAYHDSATVSVLANMGMSPQLLVLGVCLLFGQPLVFVWIVIAELGVVAALAAAPRASASRLRSSTGGGSVNVVELATRWEEAEPRDIAPADRQRYERYLAEILTGLGMDLDTPGTRDTPRRFFQAMFDATAGYDGDAKLRTAFPSERPAHVNGARSQIVEGPIAFFALCEHHALPFHGTAHIAYVAGDEILGISKLTRLVRLYARRFTVQERLGEQIADALAELVSPRGVAVHLRAAHLCTQMRGVAEERSETVTTFWRGAYDEDADLRREFLYEVRAR